MAWMYRQIVDVDLSMLMLMNAHTVITQHYHLFVS